jgi:hypothetical protein
MNFEAKARNKEERDGSVLVMALQQAFRSAVRIPSMVQETIGFANAGEAMLTQKRQHFEGAEMNFRIQASP